MDAFEIYTKADMYKWLNAHDEEAPEFAYLIDCHYSAIKDALAEGRTFSDFEEDFREDFTKLIENYEASNRNLKNGEEKMKQIEKSTAQRTNVIFVYGTLMTGQCNHSRFLKSDELMGEACISGYDMYDLGSYPGIVPGRGTVCGELYAVSDEELRKINILEGEGSLYISTPVRGILSVRRSI